MQERLRQSRREFLARIPFLAEGLGEEFSVASLIGEGIGRLGEALPGFLAGVVSFLPGAVFSVVVFLFSAFYFAVDGERMGKGVARLLPGPLLARLKALGSRAAATAVSYGKVYLVLTLVTFLLLLGGFLVLGVDYAFLFAAFLAVFDLLPLFGVGAVLVPLGLAMLFLNRAVGVGLLVLFGVIFLVRQVLEPRLIGKRLGIHPLPVLLLLYGGSRLFGLWGLLLAPPLAVLLSVLFTAEQEKSPTS